jgi:hypothetical protein
VLLAIDTTLTQQVDHFALFFTAASQQRIQEPLGVALHEPQPHSQVGKQR